jgi:hypothetical protein
MNKSNMPCKEEASEKPDKSIIQQRNIKSLHLGFFGGLIGVLLAGLLVRAVTSDIQNFASSSLILCGVFGGLGFGLLTQGNNRLRGIIACFFGFFAMLFGLMMAYTSPIIIGYMISGEPIYMWLGQPIGRFLENQLFTMNGLFSAILGILAAYIAGSKLSRKNKTKKVPTT